MKILLIAVIIVVCGDLTINHGAGTAALTRTLSGFLTWLSHVGDDSVFMR